MKLVALLGWYDENSQWLYESVRSMEVAGATHLIAVDGAYAHFPGAKRRSGQAQHDAVKDAARDAGIKVKVTTPPVPWRNEVAKRNYLFRKAEAITTEQDWYLVQDGDEVVTRANLSALETTDYLVATGTLEEPHPYLPTAKSPMRRLYKAMRGIHLKVAHDTYFLPDGRILWGHADRIDALDLQADFHMLHRTHFRDQKRRKAAKDFYADRDARREEAHPCGICGKPSVATAPYDWERIDENGVPGQRGRLSAKSMWACARHKQQLDNDAREILLKLGYDPSGLKAERQNIAAGWA